MRLLRAMRPRAPLEPITGVAARSAGYFGHMPSNAGRHALDRPDRGLWAIAEDVAEAIAADIAAPAVIGALDMLADAVAPGPDAIRSVLRRTNAAMWAARVDATCLSAASVVALHLDGGRATILWAGDSRAYRCREGNLALLTRDHSVAQELIDTGAASPGPATPQKHIVTRAIGFAPEIDVETVAIPVAPGDRLLLCSRALAELIPAAMIAGRLRAPVAEAVDALVEAALCAGAPDTVLVFAIEVC